MNYNVVFKELVYEVVGTRMNLKTDRPVILGEKMNLRGQWFIVEEVNRHLSLITEKSYYLSDNEQYSLLLVKTSAPVAG